MTAASGNLATASAFPVTTSDGVALLVRAVRPTDADELRDGFAEFSAESRYRRFFTPRSRLGDDLVERFVTPDQVDHLAIGALLTGDDGEPIDGVGVARAFRSPDDRSEAEFAVAVADAHHGDGIGSLLLDLLGAACLDVGIRTFVADVLTTNEAMLALVRARGGELRSVDGDASVTRASLPTAALSARLDQRARDRIRVHLAAER